VKKGSRAKEVGLRMGRLVLTIGRVRTHQYAVEPKGLLPARKSPAQGAMYSYKFATTAAPLASVTVTRMRR
jgi:hypothetical protein